MLVDKQDTYCALKHLPLASYLPWIYKVSVVSTYDCWGYISGVSSSIPACQIYIFKFSSRGRTMAQNMSKCMISQRSRTMPYFGQYPISCCGSNPTGLVLITNKDIFLKYFPDFKPWQEGSNQCQLMEIAWRVIKIRAKLSSGRQTESEEVKCLNRNPAIRSVGQNP